MEIINGVERRRRWRVEEKLRIVAELDQLGACVAEVARRHDVSRGLLWNWRRAVRDGALCSPAAVEFLPLQVMSPPALASMASCREAAAANPQSEVGEGTIEIVLPDGVTVRIRGEVGAASLRSALGVLRG